MAIGTPVNLGVTGTSGDGVTSAFGVATVAAIPGGDLVVLAIVIVNQTAAVTVSSVSDGTNTYSKAVSGNDGAANPVDLEIWYCQNALAVGSGATITATLSGAVTSGFPVAMAAAYVSGVATSGAADKSATAFDAAGATNVTMTTAALAHASEIAFGATYIGSSSTLTETESNGFANVNHIVVGSGIELALDYVIESSAAAVTYNPTWSQSHTVGGVVATFAAPDSNFVPYQPWAQLGPIMAQ